MTGDIFASFYRETYFYKAYHSCGLVNSVCCPGRIEFIELHIGLARNQTDDSVDRPPLTSVVLSCLEFLLRK